jgi:hypothetical protein
MGTLQNPKSAWIEIKNVDVNCRGCPKRRAAPFAKK